jgi:hypothetical protein
MLTRVTQHLQLAHLSLLEFALFLNQEFHTRSFNSDGLSCGSNRARPAAPRRFTRGHFEMPHCERPSQLSRIQKNHKSYTKM